MQWMKHSLPRFSLGLMKSGSPFIRRALSALLLSVGLSVSISRAEESSDFPETNSVLRIEDLTPEARVAVSNLAGLLSVSSSGDRAAATVEDNVAAILAILQQVKQNLNSNVSMFRTYVFSPIGQNIVDFLGPGMYESYTGTSRPFQSNSILFELQRALYGQSGVPSSSQAILPVLWRMESALTNNQSSVDMGWTNSVNAILTELNGSSLYGVSLSGWLDENLHLYPILQSIEGYFSQTVYDRSDAAYSGPSLAVYDAVLSDVWDDDASEASLTDSALRVVDPNASSALWQMEQTLLDIGYEVSNLEFPTEVAITNFGPIISWMETNLLATAHDEAQAADAHRDIEQSAEYNKAQAQAEIDDFEASDTSDFEQPFAGSAVVNPWNPLLSEASTLPDKISEKMPTFEETGGDTIVILDGQSERAEIRQIGNWSINVREELQDFVNQYGNLIDWFWNLFNSLTALGAILSIWHQVHDSM